MFCRRISLFCFLFPNSRSILFSTKTKSEILLDTEQKKNPPRCKETVSLEDFLVKLNIEIDEKSEL